MTTAVETEPKGELVAMGVSPWSFKARWALGHHGIPFEINEYLPVISEPKLRFRTGKWSGPITVPVYFTPKGEILMDSLEIAQYADQRAHDLNKESSSLFPEEFKDQIAEWNKKSDVILSNGRTISLCKALGDDELLLAMSPSWARSMPWIAKKSTASVLNDLLAKYPTRPEENLTAIRTTLQELAERLKASGGEYLLGNRFTYADVVMALSFQVLAPAADNYLPLEDGVRRVFTNPEPFPDDETRTTLLQWRDSIFSKHFPKN